MGEDGEDIQRLVHGVRPDVLTRRVGCERGAGQGLPSLGRLLVMDYS
jgi:hypothetical protein